jgi:DNA-directed RNA polymerase specialized sigma24 family protein
MTTPAQRAARAAWMAAAQQGDAEAYRALLDDIAPLVLRFVRRHVADPADAEDVAQETLLALHRARQSYLPGRPVEPWVLGIASFVVRAHHRRGARRRRHEVVVEVVPARAVDAHQAVVLAFREALRALPQALRSTVDVLAGIAPAGADDAPTDGARRVRIHRARRALRALLML